MNKLIFNHYSAKARVISRRLERYNGFIIQHIDNKAKFEEKILSTSFLFLHSLVNMLKFTSIVGYTLCGPTFIESFFLPYLGSVSMCWIIIINLWLVWPVLRLLDIRYVDLGTSRVFFTIFGQCINVLNYNYQFMVSLADAQIAGSRSQGIDNKLGSHLDIFWL